MHAQLRGITQIYESIFRETLKNKLSSILLKEDVEIWAIKAEGM